MVYIGQTENDFKTRYRNHKTSFTNLNYENEIALSKLIWSLNNNNKKYEVKWEILDQTTPYKCGTRRCNLCLLEKYYILTYKEKDLLNKKSELISTCRHRRKFLLSSVKWYLNIHIKHYNYTVIKYHGHFCNSYPLPSFE